MITVLLTLTFASIGLAAPRISLPINAQLPPVARVGKSFRFVFAESTFTPSAGEIQYNISDGPGWLYFDGQSRKFSGVPAAADTGAHVFDLLATDNSGVVSMSVTLMILNEPGPQLGTPLDIQLSTQSTFSNPDTLILPHSSPLSITFSLDTFTNTNGDTAYYAFSTNHTPLPSRLQFSPSNLSFSGMTPQSTSLVELPQTYRLELAASDMAGFAGATITFQIVVEQHIFAFSSHLHVINATSSSNITYAGLQNDLLLDGRPANSADIAQIFTSAPS